MQRVNYNLMAFQRWDPSVKDNDLSRLKMKVCHFSYSDKSISPTSCIFHVNMKLIYSFDKQSHR